MPDCPSDYAESSTITTAGRVVHVSIAAIQRNGSEQFECRVWIDGDKRRDRKAWSRDYAVLSSWSKSTAWEWLLAR